MQVTGGLRKAPMASKLELQERRALAEAERHLDAANHCLVRQLRTLSRLGRHTSNLSLAETLLKTMMQTHQLIVEGKKRLELRSGSAIPKHYSNLNKNRARASLDEEATPLLRSKRLRPKSDDNASVLS